jgi:hypothetical protein
MALLEVLMAVAIGVTGLLAHVASTLTEQRLAANSRLQTVATLVASQFVARLRGDDDWDGLYARLRLLEDRAPAHAPAALRLYDGRRAWPPQAYYPDFRPSSGLSDVGILVEVPPRARPADKPFGTPRLREDWNLPAFGLPYDLNVDGSITGHGVEEDYEALPVRVILRYASESGSQQVLVSTW